MDTNTQSTSKISPEAKAEAIYNNSLGKDSPVRRMIRGMEEDAARGIEPTDADFVTAVKNLKGDNKVENLTEEQLNKVREQAVSTVAKDRAKSRFISEYVAKEQESGWKSALSNAGAFWNGLSNGGIIDKVIFFFSEPFKDAMAAFRSPQGFMEYSKQASIANWLIGEKATGGERDTMIALLTDIEKNGSQTTAIASTNTDTKKTTEPPKSAADVSYNDITVPRGLPNLNGSKNLSADNTGIV